MPRNIVLILGNGFDLDLGLKTSYKDFWESDFCPKRYPAPLIRHLNSKWIDNLEAVRWYDLENELREYALNGDKTDVINKGEQEYIKNHSDYLLTSNANYTGNDDTCQHLIQKGLIILEEDRSKLKHVYVPYRDEIILDSTSRDKCALLHIKQGLCSYLRSQSYPNNYSSSVAAAVCRAVTNTLDSGSIVSVYSFNYTQLSSIGNLIAPHLVYHMHGNVKNENIVIGTRDDLSLDKSYDFLQKSFDPSYNPPHLVDDMAEADEVIVFGHSLGDNDRQYFAPFFKERVDSRPGQGKFITIFTRDELSKMEMKRSLQRMTGGRLSDLYVRNTVKIIRTDEIVDDLSDFRDFLTRFIPNETLRSNVLGTVITNK